MMAARLRQQGTSLLTWWALTWWACWLALLLALSTHAASSALALSQRSAGLPSASPKAQAANAGRTGPAAASTADVPTPFRITGRVVNSLSKSPVARAEVTVSPMGVRRGNRRFAGRTGAQTATAIADAEGRFAVEVPSAGGWSLNVSAPGYHPQTFEEHEGYSTAIILTDANPEHEVMFRLAPEAAIEGYVLDEAGEAVRNAQLTVSLIPPAAPDDQNPRQQNRGSQKTDDRGYYKFSGLLAGNYTVRVQAQPWYATNGANNNWIGRVPVFGGGAGTSAVSSPVPAAGTSAPDPLDVVYPVVWYPGVTEFAAATPITVREGATQKADFRLLPEAGFHLHIAGSGTTAEEDGKSAGRGSVYLSQVLADGTDTPISMPVLREPNGETEFSGLAPGTYVLHQPGEAETGTSDGTATVRIAENSAHTVDASQAIPAAPVTVKIDTAADQPSLKITFRDVETGHLSFAQSQRDSGMRGPRRGARPEDPAPAKDEDPPDRRVSLASGKYEVALNGISDLHLTGIEAKGATATGRTVTIAGGSPVLMLHVATGRANVTGFVRSHGKPVEEAMVLLVPATLGDPSGLDFARRDQSNSDGSFDITEVLPGTYILVAIDHGWDVNWSDPSTLRRFLLHGRPLDLTTPSDRSEIVEAQSP